MGPHASSRDRASGRHDSMNRFVRFMLLLSILILAVHRPLAHAGGARPFSVTSGDRVVFLGNALVEHERFHGFLEANLRRHFPGARLTFRNLGWSGDTVRGE